MVEQGDKTPCPFIIKMKNKELNIGFDSLKEMSIAEIIELDKQAGGNQE